MYIVKIGGSLGHEFEEVVQDISEYLNASRRRCIMVHGGSKYIDILGDQLQIPQKSITSPGGITSRHTTAETMNVITMALAGVANPGLVDTLIRHGIDAIGLSGMDAKIVLAERKKAIRALVKGRISLIRDSYTATIRSVNADLLEKIVDLGLLPVLSPPAIDLEAGPVNVDADRMAAAIAVATHADCLVLLTDIPGLLHDKNNPSSLFRMIDETSIDQAREAAKGRMKLKILAAEEALLGGVKKVIISDGRIRRPVQSALEGAGTHFVFTQVPELENVS